MKKRVLSIFVVIAVLVTTLVIFNPFATQEVSAEKFRGGFHLHPVHSDATGVLVDSSFVLKSQNDITLEAIKKQLSIDGESAPEVVQTAKNTFEVTPSQNLPQNKLVIFRITQAEKEEITWTFQTCAPFKILNVFPADKSSGVPYNTGIELYFSHDSYGDPDRYFEITPAVSGKFERHKNVAVFVPKELKKGTLYTVTVKKGLPLNGSEYTLTEDYTFQFETSQEENDPKGMYSRGYFFYNRFLGEYTPAEKPYLPVNYYINRDSQKENTVEISTTVYSYNGIDRFVEALTKKNSIPNWAYISYSLNQLPVDGLEKVITFDQEFEANPKDQQFVKIPQALPLGYYLVNSIWEDQTFQTLIQVTDIGMYIMKSNTKTLIWLHDLEKGEPIQDATLSLVGTHSTFHSDVDGIAYFELPQTNNAESNNADSIFYFKITTPAGKNAIAAYSNYNYRYYDDYTSSLYWNYLQTDRNLYKPDDLINLWGFLKNRYTDENIGQVTVEIGQGYNYYPMYSEAKGGSRFIPHYFPMESKPMVKQTLEVENGVFKGNLELPSLAPGGYQLTVKKGNTALINTYITIENYQKPAYKLEITKDKEAVFPGQEVMFTMKSSFFEGTAVPDLTINYNLNNGFGDTNINGTGTTNSDGSIQVKYTSKPSSQAQGENSVWVNGHSNLPEIGEISQSSTLRVFVNDINVALSSEIKNEKGTIHALVNKITLDRINNGTAKDNGDYLGDVQPGTHFTGTIYKNTWVKFEDGEYYDFINKVTQKRYRYELNQQAVGTIQMTTGSDGKADFSFNAPDIDNGYYSAKLQCTDNSGRSMHFDQYIGNFNEWYYYSYDDNRYFLDGAKESYKEGEQVNLTFKKGQKALPEGRYLFVDLQNGIRSYKTTTAPEYSFTLQPKDLPNCFVQGVYFNGLTYVESDQVNIVYDREEKNLVINAVTDKQNYKPGEEVVVKITAKDTKGNPKESVVNASIVDEALFSLQDQSVDTLATLYSTVPSGIAYSYASHTNSGMDMIQGQGGMERNEAQNTKAMAGAAPEMALNASVKMADTASDTYGGAQTAYLREVFKDTALFETVRLDKNGCGELRFKLPDNVTSWRVTLSGITSDLFAGSGKTSLTVTLPFFINYTLNSTYLVGDVPAIGVNAYGNDLKAGEKVFFEVSSSNHPEKVVRVEGKAFERVNLPLWTMEEGSDDVIIKAYTESGLADSIKHTLKVVKTYHEIDQAKYFTLKPGISLAAGTSGNTTLIFSDANRGKFLSPLTELLYTGGNRVDQRLASATAYQLIQKYFQQYDVTPKDSSFKVSEYQTQDGGIALLPYGNSDADMTTLVTALSNDGLDTGKLRQYFYTLLYDETLPGLKGNALYGLSVLKEPVLLELNKVAAVENASIKDSLFLALAYCELGETSTALKIYNEKISPKVQSYEPYLRIDTGKDNEDIIECTSLAAVLAAKLGKVDAEKLYNYCEHNATQDILLYMQKLLYIESEIDQSKEGAVKFTYTYLDQKETKTLENGQTFTLTIPSKNMASFKIESVEGEVAAVSMFKEAVSQVYATDSNIKVSRTYAVRGNSTPSNTFKQNDIVRVEISCDMGTKAMDGGYQITDFLPSGLKPIESPWNFGIQPGRDDYYGSIDGQKVTFYVYNDKKQQTRSFGYYARVITPGTYQADAPIIQGTLSRESMNLGNVGQIVIEK